MIINIMKKTAGHIEKKFSKEIPCHDNIRSKKMLSNGSAVYDEYGVSLIAMVEDKILINNEIISMSKKNEWS